MHELDELALATVSQTQLDVGGRDDFGELQEWCNDVLERTKSRHVQTALKRAFNHLLMDADEVSGSVERYELDDPASAAELEAFHRMMAHDTIFAWPTGNAWPTLKEATHLALRDAAGVGDGAT